MSGAGTIAGIISDNYGTSGGGGDTPTKIAKAQYGQGDFYRFEWFDECILIHRPSKEFTQQGVAQFYEKDSEYFKIEIAAISGETRYDEIEAEVRRIALNYGGGDIYTRIHIDSMKDLSHHCYAVAEGIIVGYLHLSHANTS